MRKKYKEESHAGAYSFDSQYLNIYEMENLIMALSNKLTRLEMGNKYRGKELKNVTP